MNEGLRHIHEGVAQQTPPESFVHKEEQLSTKESSTGSDRLQEILKNAEQGGSRFPIFDIQPQSNTRKDWDELLDNLVAEYTNYPNAVEEALSMVLQDGQMFTPDKLITTLSNLLASEKTSNYLKDSIIHGLNYLISFYPELYTGPFLKHLDFDNQEKFAETGSFLEMLKSVFIVGGDWSFSEDTVPFVVRETLIDALEKKKGSYLLALRCQELVELMKHDGDDMYEQGDMFPFELSPGIFAIHKNDKLFVSQEGSASQITDLTRQILELKKRCM